MKIKVDAGKIVRLGNGLTTSARGGVYDLLRLGLQHEAPRLLEQDGVTRLVHEGAADAPDHDEEAQEPEDEDEEEGGPSGTTQWGRAGLTLEEAAAMTDEELLAVPGIGEKSVKKIRKLTEG